ncbi:dihydroorotate dehydrogenase [Alkalihalobacillus sp. AL-G]|uniref:dihydroorotate dehydrogenase n=1 Tax=Alkalihalobacillus sp. AL-G TaxID=2926399 RepID=UPI00272A3204|nr:dihydroorotate dehydrogenase [Alkalihalobacillus sp. AL-G]WLD91583.1 dihydroorotate dehydrogenase [Alkalihalobacillus sp. AL-G]
MPDWSYHTFFKPLLNRLAPEKARTITLRTMNTLVSLPFGYRVIEFFGHMAPLQSIQKRVCGIEVSSPIGLSGQVDPQLEGIRALSCLGFGFIEIGPVTRNTVKQPDIKLNTENDTIEYSHLLENRGVEQTEKVLSVINLDVPILLRIGEKSLKDILYIIEKLNPFVDWIVVDINIKQEDLSLIRKMTKRPILINVDEKSFKKSLFNDVDGFYLSEGQKNQRTYKVGQFELPNKLDQVKHLIHFRKPIVASGGVHEPGDALELLEAGADLIQLHSGFVYSGPGLPKRINEVISSNHTEPKHNQRGWLSSFFMGFGVFIAGLIACFVGLTDVLLAYDEQFLGMKKEEIQQFSEQLFYFMSHDRISLAGVMISAGFLYMMLAYFGIRTGQHWARKVFYVAATLGFLNFFYFLGFGYLDRIHLLYNALILPFFLYGFYHTRTMSQGETGYNLRNTDAWRKSQFGQSMFIILGAAFLTAGIVISFIGLTNVFVKEDLGYLHLEPDQIHEHNENFIPLIAHDRAGFGGALLSVGLLISLISLWGFREGEKWVWWALTLGGIPGFAAGIGIHYHIGYVDQYHLSPAYFAFLLYILGVFYSYPYLMKKGDYFMRKTNSI